MEAFNLFAKLGLNADEFNQGLQRAEGRAQGFGQKLGGLGRAAKIGVVGAAAAGATAIAGMAAEGVNLARQMNAATRDFQTTLGATEAEAQRLADTAKNVYANNFGGSLTEAAAAVRTVRMTMKDLEDNEMQGVTEAAIGISDAFDVDLQESTQAANTLMREFGLSGAEAMNFINEGMQRGLNTSGDFLETVTEYGTQFSNAGADAGEFFSLMETGQQDGMLGTDKMADAFKEFRIRVGEGSDNMRDAFSAMGMDYDSFAEKMESGQISAAEAFSIVTSKIGEVEGEMERMSVGQMVMGTQFEDIGDAAFENLNLAQTSMEDLQGSTDALATQYDSLPAIFQGLRRQLVVLLEPIGQELLGALRGLLGWLQENMPAIKATVRTAMEGMSAAWNDVLKPAFEAIRPLLEHVILPILGALVTNGFQVITGAIETLAALLRGDFKGAWEGAKKVIGGVVDFLRDVAGTAIEQFLVAIGRSVVQIGNAARDIIVAFVGGVRQSIHMVTAVMGNVASAVWEEISGLPERLWNLGVDVVEGLVGGIGDKVDDAREAVTGLFSGIFGQAEEEAEIESPSKRMMRMGEQLVEGLNLGIKQNADILEGTISDVLDRINRKGQDLRDSIEEWQSIAARQIDVRVDTSQAERALENLENLQARILREARAARIDRLQEEARASTFGPSGTGTLSPVGVGQHTPAGPQPLTEAGTQQRPVISMASRTQDRARVQADRQNIDRFQRATDQFSNDVQRLSLANLRY